MIPEKLKAALDEHVTAEIASAYLYLAMSAEFEAKSWKGFAKWMRVQHLEEMAHALKMVDYVLARGAAVAWKAIEAPVASFATPLEAFERTLAHEKAVTARIHALYHLAVAENDLPTQLFLQWYVTEQVEEEANVSEIIDKLRIVGDRSGGALYLDKEFGKRAA